MKIGIAKPEQARAIAETQVLSWQQAYKHLIPHDFLTTLSVSERESMWIEVISLGKATVLTAEVDKKLVGFICIGDSRDPDLPPGHAEIWAFYLSPDYWRSGIGRKLWLAAEPRLIEKNYQTVCLWVFDENPRAISFYKSLGYEQEADTTTNFDIAGVSIAETRYHLQLNPVC